MLSITFSYLIYEGELSDVCEEVRSRLGPVLETGMQVNIATRVHYSNSHVLFQQQLYCVQHEIIVACQIACLSNVFVSRWVVRRLLLLQVG